MGPFTKSHNRYPFRLAEKRRAWRLRRRKHALSCDKGRNYASNLNENADRTNGARQRRLHRLWRNRGRFMRNCDLVSGSLLTLTAAGIVLLCSSLLAFVLV
ncbi:hypothetical protein EI171_11380 [Bradyrhizobium sp. LCT2]|nr:hypothetical protein EI171_11380 [Bradyrhizobium sp. LCT2]